MPNIESALQITGAPTVADVMDVFIRNQNSPATQKAYKWDLARWTFFFGDLNQPPTLKDAIDFKQWLETEYKTRTAGRIFNTCRVFYRFLGVFNPFEQLKSPKATVNRTPEVPSDLLIEKMLDLEKSGRDQLILCLLLNGLRRSEVANLQATDVWYDNTYGRDILRVIGKGNKERLVPANLNTSTALRRFGWEPNSNWQGQLVLGLSPRAVEYTCETWTKAAGQYYSPHKLRHHYGTRLHRNGVDIHKLATLLGHSSVETTKIYVHLNMKDIVDAAALDPMDREIYAE